MKAKLSELLQTALEKGHTLKSLNSLLEKYDVLDIQIDLPSVQGVFKTLDEFPDNSADLEQVKAAAKVKNDRQDQSSKGILAMGF